MIRRLPFLGRLARRYAVRHKGQTVRAILGLLVATTVLTTGLGMGESIATSLENEALKQFGPIDLTLRSPTPFPADDVARALAKPDVRALGIRGAPSISLVGAALNPDKGLAEAFATVRGVSPDEAEALGALPGGAAEPRAGEVVLSDTLATRLDANVGDRVSLRVAPPGGAEADFETTTLVGVAGAPRPGPTQHTLQVREDALGLGGQLQWTGEAGRVSLIALSPSGIEFANASDLSPLQLVVPGPVEAGAWTFRVDAAAPVFYQGVAGAAYLPGALSEATTLISARVSAIVPEEGRAGVTGRPSALLPLGVLQDAIGARGNATDAYFMAPGDPHVARDRLHAAFGQIADEGDLRAAKADVIQNAKEAGAEITGFLLVMGAFTLLAAVLLAFTLFSALVEERRAELGIARALGLTRGEVALAMTLEGALYSAAAALAGLLVGVLALAGLLRLIDSFANMRGGPSFALHLSDGTLLAAFLIGTLLPLATIGLASLRFARLDPARAIRGIPDDPKASRMTGLLMGIAILALGLVLSLGPNVRLVGLPLLLSGFAVMAWSRGWPRVGGALMALAFGHVGWTLYTYSAFPEDANELDPILTLARGGFLALALSTLAVVSTRPWDRLSRLIGGGATRRSSFLAFRYLVSRRRPTGLTMAMVSLVVVIVTVMGTLFSVFSSDFPEDEAGYAVLGESALPLDGFPRPLPADLAPSIERADFLPRHVEFRQANVTRNGEPVEMRAGSRQFLGVTPGFAAANEYVLSSRAAAYSSDRDAWNAVAAGDAMLAPSWVLERNGLTAGDIITIQTTLGGPREYVLAGGVESDFAFQTFLPMDHVEAMGFPTGASVFVRVADGADPDTVAHRLSGEYAEDGVTFTSVPEEVARVSAAAQALVLVFESFLALGVFVGLAATGFLASRAVHERMRDIGTLRALGYEEKDVSGAFLLESLMTAGGGLLIGTATGLVVAHSIWWRSIRDDGVPFRPPWLLLVAFAAAVLALAAFASRGPARRAARLPPAIAVRHVE